MTQRKHPARHFAGNLMWTRTGQVWAGWTLRPLPRARTEDAAHAVHNAHAALFRSLAGRTALLRGLLTWTDPVDVVSRMISGIDLSTHPDWARECEAAIDLLDQIPLGQRRWFLTVPVTAPARRTIATAVRSAANEICDAVGLHSEPPSRGEIAAYVAAAAQIQRQLPAVFHPTPMTAAEQVWTLRHAQTRSLQGEVDPIQAPGLAAELLDTVTGRAAIGDPWLDPMALSDLEPRDRAAHALSAPFTRRVLKVATDSGAVNYQAAILLADVPAAGMVFPTSEFIGRVDDSGVPLDVAIRVTVRSRHDALRRNKKSMRQLNDQLGQVDGTGPDQGSHQVRLYDAAELLADYNAEMVRDTKEVEVEPVVVLSTVGATFTDADANANDFIAATGNRDFTYARPVGSEEAAFWAMQPGGSVEPQICDYRLITKSAAFATSAAITTSEAGSDAGWLFGINKTSALWTPVFMDLFGDARRDISPSLVVVGELGAGKALALDTPVPTPDGWSTMGDLRVGDEVFDHEGQITQVTSTSPVMTGHVCYDVVFSDGSVITADADHLWVTVERHTRDHTSKHNHRCRSRGSSTLLDARAELDTLTGPEWPRHGTTLTTDQMARTLRAGGQINHAVPVTAALDLPPADVPIDPYVLGCWLGDGTRTTAGFSTADPEILGFIEAAGYTVTSNAGRYAYSIGIPQSGRPEPEVKQCGWCGTGMVCQYPRRRYCSQVCATAARTAGRPPIPAGRCEICTATLKRNSIAHRCPTCARRATFTGRLRDLNLLDNKHVPTRYLRGSRAQRQALLAGLLDTDGTTSPRGAVEYATTTQQLARDVHELICSLGYRASSRQGRATLYGKDCGPKWTVSFTTTDDVFWLARKRATHRRRRTQSAPARNRYRYVVGVRPTSSMPVRCITVAADSQIFLVGPAMIPTHNSVAQKAVCGHAVSRGARLIATDVSATREWVTFAQSLASDAEPPTTISVCDVANPTKSLDPLRLLPEHLSGPVLQSFLITLLDIGATSVEGRTLAKTVKPRYLAQHHLRSLADLHRHLATDCDLPEAHAIADRIDVFVDPDLGGSLASALFDPTLPPLDTTADVIVIGTSNVTLPTDAELVHAHLYRNLPVEKIFGRALYALIARLAEQLCFADPAQPWIFDADEFHCYRHSSEAVAAFIRFIRYGRKSQAAVIAGSHDTEADFADETLRGLIKNKLVMRLTDEKLATKAATFLGADPVKNPQEHAELIAKIRQLSPDPDGRGVPDARRGEGIYLDPRGRIADITVLRPALNDRFEAAKTTPPEQAAP